MLASVPHARPSLITVKQSSPEQGSVILAVSLDGVPPASYHAPLGGEAPAEAKNAVSKNLAGTFSFEQLNETFTHTRRTERIFPSLCALVALHRLLPDCILRPQFFRGRPSRHNSDVGES
jgi:hypothetical protein